MLQKNKQNRTKNLWREYRRSISQGCFHTAIETASLASHCHEADGDLRHACIWQRALANAYYLKGMYRNAFSAVIPSIRKQPDSYEKAVSLIAAGVFLTFRGKYRGAFICFDRAAALASSYTEDIYLWTHLYGTRANAYRRTGRIDLAIVDWEGAAALLKESGQLWRAAIFINNIGYLLTDQGCFDEAEQRLLESLELVEKAPHVHTEALISDSIGYLYTLTGRYTEAERYVSRAVRIFEQISDKSQLADTLIHASLLHRSQHQYETARDEACRALHLAMELNSSARMGKAREHIKLVLLDQLQASNASIFEAHKSISARALGRAVWRSLHNK